MTPPVSSFTRADGELLARYGSARVRWSRVDAASKRKLADLQRRVKQLIATQLMATVADPQVLLSRLTTFVSPTHSAGRVPAEYWGCLYPAAIPSKAFALQIAFSISAAGAELCLCMGSGRRESRDPMTAAQNRRGLEEIQQQLATLPPDVLDAVDRRLAGQWRYVTAQSRARRGKSNFANLSEWAQYAASPLGQGASVSCFLSLRELERLGDKIVDRCIETLTDFAPLLQYIYSEDTPSPEPEIHDSQQTYGIPADDVGRIAERAPVYGNLTPAAVIAPPVATSRPTPPRPFTAEMAESGLFIPRDELQHMLALLDRRRNLILEGAPGVGKTFIARRLAYTLLGERNSPRMEMVQFHPSYAYEDFVRGWRPAAGGSFTLHDGVFYKFCEAARADTPARPYVFVIDEINRGNVSGIFGELLMLLERDKRGDEFSVPLTYTLGRNDRFSIPPNVYLIATMNTTDRSVAMVDYALRRRFAFVRLRPAFGEAAFTDYLTTHGVSAALTRRISTRMLALNTAIVDDRKRLGPGFEIGHSAFVPIGAGPYNDAWYRDIIHTEIEPLLHEYWFDDPDRAAEAIARLLA